MTIKELKDILKEAQLDGITVVQSAKLAALKACSIQGEPSLVRKWTNKLTEAGCPNVGQQSPHPKLRALDSSFVSLTATSTTPIDDMSF